MNNTFGAFLKEKRQEKNLTQKQLAKELFVSESLVSKWEKGVSHPDITILPKLSALLGVTEHELITASIDEGNRQDKKDAKKWRTLSSVWSLFFIISYVVALIPCFICNLAINKTLSWFFIVLSALILAFSFTNLPKLIKKHRLIFVPLSQFLALNLLLGVVAIYTKGAWFFVASFSVLLGLIIVFAPIFISKYAPEKIKKFNDFISVFIDFLALNVLLIVVYFYTKKQGFSAENWYLKLGVPISFTVYFALNILLLVRFLGVNKLIKTSIIIFLSTVFFYIPPLLIKPKNQAFLKELNEMNILRANLSVWDNSSLENNVHLIVFLSCLLISLVFLFFGLIKKKMKNNNLAIKKRSTF